MNLRAKWGGSGQDEKVGGHSPVLATGGQTQQNRGVPKDYMKPVSQEHTEFMGGSPLEPHQTFQRRPWFCSLNLSASSGWKAATKVGSLSEYGQCQSPESAAEEDDE